MCPNLKYKTLELGKEENYYIKLLYIYLKLLIDCWIDKKKTKPYAVRYLDKYFPYNESTRQFLTFLTVNAA